MEKANIIIFSLPFSLFFKVNLTSFLKVKMIFFVSLYRGKLIFHIGKESMSIAIIMISQEIEKIAVLGSKTEKRFIIILLSFF